MAVTKQQKKDILEALIQEIEVQKAIVLLSTDGAKESLSASKNAEFRTLAMKGGVKLTVVKNTLVKKALEKFQLPEFTASTYVAYLVDPKSGDEVTVPKVTVDLVKDKFENNLKVLGAVVNGEFYDAQKTIQLSKVASFADSMSMVAGMLQQITAKIAIGVREIPASVARGVAEASKKLS